MAKELKLSPVNAIFWKGMTNDEYDASIYGEYIQSLNGDDEKLSKQVLQERLQDTMKANTDRVDTSALAMRNMGYLPMFTVDDVMSATEPRDTTDNFLFRQLMEAETEAIHARNRIQALNLAIGLQAFLRTARSTQKAGYQQSLPIPTERFHCQDYWRHIASVQPKRFREALTDRGFKYTEDSITWSVKRSKKQ